MVKDNAVRIKSEQFGVRIIKLYTYLCNKYHLYDIFRQILCSGTSIGANIAEAECAISEKDFLAKMYISLKEALETLYWLKLLKETGYLTADEYNSMREDCEELIKLLTSITKTLSEKLKTN